MKEKQTFSYKQKPRKFTANRTALQEKLKQIFQAKVYDTREKLRSARMKSTGKGINEGEPV